MLPKTNIFIKLWDGKFLAENLSKKQGLEFKFKLSYTYYYIL